MGTTVSAIVAVKDGAAHLADALESVRRQEGSSIDLVVVDGRSRDGSREIAVRAGARVIDQAGDGLGDAWNAGLEAATGRYITFLDSDDLWTAGSVRRRLDALEASDAADVSYGAVRHFAESVDPDVALPRAAMDLDHVAPIPGTMLVRREIFARVGRFDVGLALAGDADWIARAISLGTRFVTIPDVVLLKRLHGSNLTRRVSTVKGELLTALRRKIATERRSG